MAERYSPQNVFLNVPYDPRYEKLFIALIAGLSCFGLLPRATLEIPGPTRRLDRILDLIAACRYSFHDLSRVQLSRSGTPRFNMPFEAGLAVAIARSRPDHQWFLLEARAHRIHRTLSDLGGTDPYVHRNSPQQLLVALTDALVRVARQPTLDELDEVFQLLRTEANAIRRSHGTLFGARAFRDLVVVAVDFATRIGPLAGR